MSVLTRYLSRLVLERLGFVLLAVAGFTLLFDLLDNGSKVIRLSEAPPSIALARYALIRVPTLIADLVPIITLMAGLLTAAELLRHSELVAIWSAGASRPTLIRRLVPLALLLAAGKLFIDDVLVPRTIPPLRELRIGEFRMDTRAADDVLWLRTGEDILRLPTRAAISGELRDITIFDRDQDLQLVARLRAEHATQRGDHWQLRDVTRWPSSAAPAERLDTLTWPVAVDLDKVALMARPPRELPLWWLARAVRSEGWGIAAVQEHAASLHARMAAVATPGLMLFLAFALARQSGRENPGAMLFIKGLAIGFVFLIVEGILMALANVGLLAPALAAWLAPAVLAGFLVPMCFGFRRTARALSPAHRVVPGRVGAGR